MFKRSLQTLMVVLFSLVVACAETKKQEISEKPSVEKTVMTGKFDDRKALEILYGSFNASLNGAERAEVEMPPSLASDPPFSKGVARTLLSKTYFEKGVKRRIFLAASVPVEGNYTCHACVPIVSGAFFLERNGAWSLESKIPVIELKGEFGKVATCTWQEIGADKFALVVFDLDGNQGVVRKSWDVYEFKNGKPISILSHTDDYDNQKKLETSLIFDKAGKSVWDAVITSKRKRKPPQRFEYVDGKYVKAQLSAQQN